MNIQAYQSTHLLGLTELINYHVSVVVPEWSLPSNHIQHYLESNPKRFSDPWVIERKTLCVLKNNRVVAATHLLRYGTSEPVRKHDNTGDIAWLLAYPEHSEAADALLKEAQVHMLRWSVSEVRAWNANLPVPLPHGIPEVWAHIVPLFRNAGFQPTAKCALALYGGNLDAIPVPSEKSPIEGLILKQHIHAHNGIEFNVWINDEEVGGCRFWMNLDDRGNIPALRNWTHLLGMHVFEPWGDLGIGSWIIQNAAVWLRSEGFNHVVFEVFDDDDAAGAGRFYHRFGWNVFTRLQLDWVLQPTT